MTNDEIRMTNGGEKNGELNHQDTKTRRNAPRNGRNYKGICFPPYRRPISSLVTSSCLRDLVVRHSPIGKVAKSESLRFCVGGSVSS